MSSNDPFRSGAHERLASINREITEINIAIVRDLHVLDKKPRLIDELIRRCEMLLCELLEVRAATDDQAKRNPALPSNHPRSESSNGKVGSMN